MIGLPPGTTQTFEPDTVMPRVRETYSAIASRNSGKAAGRAVAGPAFVDGALPRFLDVQRRREIGLTDLEVDDALALRFERAGAGEDFECGLRPDPGHAFSEFHG